VLFYLLGQPIGYCLEDYALRGHGLHGKVQKWILDTYREYIKAA